MNKKILLAILVITAISFPAFADNISTDCAAGGALDQFQCIQSKLVPLEKQLNELINNATEKTKSMWGDKATAELKQRIKTSQSAWLQYRNELCMRNYYKKAPDHPPSLSLDISVCKYRKTEERIIEIKKFYLNERD